MERIILLNKPLVEAIFEIKWKLKELDSGGKIDPHYKLLVGRLFDRLNKKYPWHEQLPTASIPDEMVENVVQHRFRKSENDWPLIQIGPGIFAVNDTKDYVWEDFEKRIIEGVNTLYEVYPESDHLIITSIMLRYIDAIEFDFEKDDISQFLKDKMKIEFSMPSQLFDGTNIEKKPLNFNLTFSYPCSEPSSTINLRLSRGQRYGKDVLMWETIVHSSSNIPKLSDELNEWLTNAHDITDDWFFKLIEGNLLERFK